MTLSNSPSRPVLLVAAITETPPAAIRELVLDSLRRFGATEEGDLTREVASQLGFARTGAGIKSGIGECFEAMVREGKVGRDDGRILPVAPRANVS